MLNSGCWLRITAAYAVGLTVVATCLALVSKLVILLYIEIEGYMNGKIIVVSLVMFPGDKLLLY